MKILIVDDSLMDRKLAMNALHKGGVCCEILQAKNGEEGIQILSESAQEICLILLDWQMPIIDGIEFMRTVGKNPVFHSIPIVMVSASGSDENKRFAREINPDLASYIVKPYAPQLLVDTVKHYIR